MFMLLQSGSALADWALIQSWERAQNTSKVFGRHLGCAVDSSWKLVACLRTGRSFIELGNAEFRVSMRFYFCETVALNFRQLMFQGVKFLRSVSFPHVIFNLYSNRRYC